MNYLVKARARLDLKIWLCRGSFSSRQHDVLSGRYTMGPEKEKKIFASRYKLLLPSEAELKAELLRELKSIGPAAAFRLAR